MPMISGLEKIKRFKGLGYLASPFSDKSPVVEEKRYTAILQISGLFTISGAMVISPIVYGYHLYKNYGNIAGDADYWKDFNRYLLYHAPYLMIVMLEGYKDSKGIQAEFAQALTLNKPIFTLELPTDALQLQIKEYEKFKIWVQKPVGLSLVGGEK